MAKRPPHKKPRPLTVAHVTNAISQMEVMLQSVRLALSGLDPNMVLEVDPNNLLPWPKTEVTRRFGKDCPPPE